MRPVWAGGVCGESSLIFELVFPVGVHRSLVVGHDYYVVREVVGTAYSLSMVAGEETNAGVIGDCRCFVLERGMVVLEMEMVMVREQSVDVGRMSQQETWSS
jgi:hypothetical protein